MNSLLNYDDGLARELAEEFVAARYEDADYQFACLHKSRVFPQRQIFALEVSGRKFALKVDTEESGRKRLQQECHNLKQVEGFFRRFDRLGVPRPHYLSRCGRCLFVDLVEGKTARETFQLRRPDNQLHQVFRRSGEWLHAMHEMRREMPREMQFGWIFEELEKAIQNEKKQAEASEYEPFFRQIRRDFDVVKGTSGDIVFSHGDFHSGNLMFSKGNVIAIDFETAKPKHAVLDIVDFLKDDFLCKAEDRDIAPSGVHEKHMEMFFKLHRHTIDPTVLTFLLRARLLIDWLQVPKERYEKTKYHRGIFDSLFQRLSLAFETTLSKS